MFVNSDFLCQILCDRARLREAIAEAVTVLFIFYLFFQIYALPFFTLACVLIADL